MINWQYFPKSDRIPNHLNDVVEVFIKYQKDISSEYHHLKSNDVLNILREELENLNFHVEKSKRSSEKIKVPVLFGKNGILEKYFEADGYNNINKTVIEVEAGRGYTNHQFLKDLFQASVMHEVQYLIIALRNLYRDSKDFDKVIGFMETLYSSSRLTLPLNGILIIGY